MAAKSSRSSEPDPDDLSFLQTQAPHKGDEEEEDETDAGESGSDDMDTAGSDGDAKEAADSESKTPAKTVDEKDPGLCNLRLATAFL